MTGFDITANDHFILKRNEEGAAAVKDWKKGQISQICPKVNLQNEGWGMEGGRYLW